MAQVGCAMLLFICTIKYCLIPKENKNGHKIKKRREKKDGNYYS